MAAATLAADPGPRAETPADRDISSPMVKVEGDATREVDVGRSANVDLAVYAANGIREASVYSRDDRAFRVRKVYTEEPVRLHLQIAFPTVTSRARFLEPGKYALEVEIVDGNGERFRRPIGLLTIRPPRHAPSGDLDLLLTAHRNWLKDHRVDSEYVRRSRAVLPDPPTWKRSRAGTSDEVPPPFEPLVREGDTLRVWGRTIEIGGSGLPARVVSGTQELLAAPARFHIEPGGAADAPSLEFTEITPARASWTSTTRYAGFRLEVDGTLEFDGFMRYRVRMVPELSAAPERFFLELPLKESAARYINYLAPGTRAPDKSELVSMRKTGFGGGIIDAGYRRLPFSFQYSMLNETAGLLFAVETEQAWRVEDRQHMYSLDRDAETVVFQVRFADRPAVPGDIPLDLQFALQVLPVKPFPDRARMDEFNAMQWPDATAIYDQKFHLRGSVRNTLWSSRAGNDGPLPSSWDQAADDGLRTMVVHQGWTELQGYPGSLDTQRIDALKRFVEDAHARGMKAIIYIGLEISLDAPEWKDFGAEFAKMPIRFGRSRGGVRALRPNGGNRAYTEFVVHRLRDLILRTDIDGVFLDLLPEPQVCMNLEHGRGYRAADGTIRGTLAAFENRELIKRIYSLFHQAPKRNGIVIGHVSGPFRPAHAFCDYIVSGEAETFAKRSMPRLGLDDIMDLTRFRAVYNHKVWGTPLIWLTKPLRGGFNMSQNGAVLLLHDVLQRTQWPHFMRRNVKAVIENPAADAHDEWKVWRAHATAGLDYGQWHPYWENRSLVDGLPGDVHTSFWVVPGKRILAVVSNLSAELVAFDLAFRLEALGFGSPPARIADPVTGEAFSPPRDEGIRLEIPPKSYRLITMEW